MRCKIVILEYLEAFYPYPQKCLGGQKACNFNSDFFYDFRLLQSMNLYAIHLTGEVDHWWLNREFLLQQFERYQPFFLGGVGGLLGRGRSEDWHKNERKWKN